MMAAPRRDDVLIAGGGPAGALSALILARAGLRVRVFERQPFPRHKLCGDTLNPGALALLQRHLSTDGLARVSLPIDGMVLTGPGGVSLRGRYPAGVIGRAVLRRDLDAMVLDAAAAAGVVVEEGTAVTGAVVEQGWVTGLRTRRHGSAATHHAPLTLAADGRRSPVATGLGLAAHPRHPRRWAVGAYYDGVTGTATVGEMHVRDGHYIGLSPTWDGRTNVCCVTGSRATIDWRQPDAALAAVVARDRGLADRFRHARAVTRAVVLGPLAVETPVPGAPGLLLAGDAAGFIDPMTGDGLRFAYAGAEMAADVALRTLAGTLPSATMVAELTRLRRRAFARKWRFNRIMRSLVGSTPGVAGAAAAATMMPTLFASLIRYAGDCHGSRSAGDRRGAPHDGR